MVGNLRGKQRAKTTNLLFVSKGEFRGKSGRGGNASGGRQRSGQLVLCNGLLNASDKTWEGGQPRIVSPLVPAPKRGPLPNV